MHDPNVVAFEIRLPIPVRRWRSLRKSPNWVVRRKRFTNAEHFGQPIYAWCRLKAWEVIMGGRVMGWWAPITVWHVEPGGRDSGEVCKHWIDGRRSHAWRWHVHHWRITVPPVSRLRARLFNRCELCGLRGNPNVSHGWDGSTAGQHWWNGRRGLYHRHCSELWSARRSIDEHKKLLRWVIAALAVETDRPVAEVVEQLTGSHVPEKVMSFHARYGLTRICGFKRDDNYRLKSACTGDAKCRAEVHIHGCFADIEGPCWSPLEHQRMPETTR